MIQKKTKGVGYWIGVAALVLVALNAVGLVLRNVTTDEGAKSRQFAEEGRSNMAEYYQQSCNAGDQASCEQYKRYQEK